MNPEAKRLLMAFALTFGFLFLWSKYFAPKPQPVTAPTTTSSQTPAASSTAPIATITPSLTNVSQTTMAAANVRQIPIETYQTQTNDLKGLFTNQSGALTSVQLTHYLKEQGKEQNLISVVPLAENTKSPLLWDVSLRTSQSTQPQFSLQDQQTVYNWKEKSSTQVEFSTNLDPQIKVTKIYRMNSQPYVIDHILRIENQSSASYYVDAATSLSATHDIKSKKKGFFMMLQAPAPDTSGVGYAHEESFHWSLDDFAKGKINLNQTPIDWSGFASQYFLLTAIPVEGVWNDVKGVMQEDVAQLNMSYPQRNLTPGSSIEYSVKLYAGPKQIEVLQSVHPTLDRSVDLGSWIGGLARLIHKLLTAIYKFIPNYGWAIIILTVLVRLAVFPLAQMQAKSMKRMTQHKPAMDALKAKFANDKEAYSRELMSYMRTNRINPASGCLPLLIQFPVFIALYRVLYNSIELRHAPFGLWIHDLSAHDPFFVLPVLVGITFYFQTKLNPTPMADPAQQTVMKIMPVLFSVFMIFLPSGLNLYIFVSTLWGIVQQYMVQKQTT